MRDALYNSAMSLRNVKEVMSVVRRQMVGDEVLYETNELVEHTSMHKEVMSHMKIGTLTLEELVENILLISMEDNRERKIQQFTLRMMGKKKDLTLEDDQNQLLNHRHKRLINILSLSQ